VRVPIPVAVDGGFNAKGFDVKYTDFDGAGNCLTPGGFRKWILWLLRSTNVLAQLCGRTTRILPRALPGRSINQSVVEPPWETVRNIFVGVIDCRSILHFYFPFWPGRSSALSSSDRLDSQTCGLDLPSQPSAPEQAFSELC
jgi:hypothetical protein